MGQLIYPVSKGVVAVMGMERGQPEEEGEGGEGGDLLCHVTGQNHGWGIHVPCDRENNMNPSEWAVG